MAPVRRGDVQIGHPMIWDRALGRIFDCPIDLRWYVLTLQGKLKTLMLFPARSIVRRNSLSNANAKIRFFDREQALNKFCLLT
jgi:hypothetical protein